MRKIIASISALMAIGFAVALANAEDTNSMQQPGTLGNDSGSVTSEASKNLDEAAQSTDKMTKTCTDSNGVTYHPGKKGFDHCVSQLKKAEKSNEQMGNGWHDCAAHQQP